MQLAAASRSASSWRCSERTSGSGLPTSPARRLRRPPQAERASSLPERSRTLTASRWERSVAQEMRARPRLSSSSREARSGADLRSANGDRLRPGQVAGEVDQMDAGVEQRLVAYFVRAPGVAAEAQLQVELEPALGGDRVAQLGPVQEAAVEGEEGLRVQRRQSFGPGEVRRRRLLDQRADACRRRLLGEARGGAASGAATTSRSIGPASSRLARSVKPSASPPLSRQRPQAVAEAIGIGVGEGGDRHAFGGQRCRYVAALGDPPASGDPQPHHRRPSVAC